MGERISMELFFNKKNGIWWRICLFGEERMYVCMYVFLEIWNGTRGIHTNLKHQVRHNTCTQVLMRKLVACISTRQKVASSSPSTFAQSHESKSGGRPMGSTPMEAVQVFGRYCHLIYTLKWFIYLFSSFTM